MKTVEVKCSYCGKTVLKPQGEYNRRIRLGKTEFYCNNTCGSKISANIERLKPFSGQTQFLIPENRRDELTDFRWYMKILKNPNRQRRNPDGTDIDLKYLKELWEQQKGICPVSGITMKLRTHNNCKDGLAEPHSASLDRIDNDLGYVKGNVRYICFMANIARSRFSDEQLIEFCKRVADHNFGGLV